MFGKLWEQSCEADDPEGGDGYHCIVRLSNHALDITTSFPVFNKRVVILAPIPQLFWLDSMSLYPAPCPLLPFDQI